MFHFHKLKEIDRYLMSTGEDMVFYGCIKKGCNYEKQKMLCETMNGKADAPSYAEWERNRKDRLFKNLGIDKEEAHLD